MYVLRGLEKTDRKARVFFQTVPQTALSKIPKPQTAPHHTASSTKISIAINIVMTVKKHTERNHRKFRISNYCDSPRSKKLDSAFVVHGLHYFWVSC